MRIAVLGVGLIYGPLPVRWPIRLLTDCIRGIPILVAVLFGWMTVTVDPLTVTFRKWNTCAGEVGAVAAPHR